MEQQPKNLAETKETIVYHATVFMSLAVSASQSQSLLPASNSRPFQPTLISR